MMTSQELFDAGYAVPSYDMMSQYRYWRFREEQFKVPAGSVPLVRIQGFPYDVGRIEDVRKAKEKHEQQ